jgi:hypothetical protein
MKKVEEGITKIKDFFIAYHRTRYDHVRGIIEDGFITGYGSLYGEGWYFTYDLKSQENSSMTRRYGDTLIKAKINPKNLLIFDYNISKEIFGKKYTLKDQLIEHYKIYRDIIHIPRDLFEMSENLEKTFQQQSYSAHIAYHWFVKNYVDSQGQCKIKDVRGIVFTGNQDGNVLVSYSYETAIPFEFTLTDPTSGAVVSEWTPVSMIDRVSRRASNAQYILDKFGGSVKNAVIAPEYNIENMEKDFPWLFDCKMKNASIEITREKELIWHDGTWVKGHWKGDFFKAGVFKSGTWFKGVFSGGTFLYGNWLDGTFSSGIWEDGTWRGGIWLARENCWLKGEVEVNGRLIKTKEAPPSVIVESSSEFLDTQDLLDESFDYGSLSQEDKDELYNNFKKAYEKAIGIAWDKNMFNSRAYGWTFFGSKEGGVALRKQKSGMYKLNASYGSPRKVIEGFQEMEKEIGSDPIWGVMTLTVADLLEKVSKGEFKKPPKLFVKTVIPHIKHIFGSEIKEVKKNGAIIVSTPAGNMEKFLIANKAYYRTLLDNAKNNPEKVPVPKSVLSILISVLKNFI